MKSQMKLKKFLKGSQERAGVPLEVNRKSRMVMMNLTLMSIMRTSMKP